MQFQRPSPPQQQQQQHYDYFNKQPCFSSQNHVLPCLLAAIILKQARTSGNSGLDCLAQIKSSRGLVKRNSSAAAVHLHLQDQYQQCPSSLSQLSDVTTLVTEEQNRNHLDTYSTITERVGAQDFSPERTASPPPGPRPSFMETIAELESNIKTDSSDNQMKELLQQRMNETLRRWKLEHELKLDQLCMRLEPIRQEPVQPDRVVKKRGRPPKKRKIQDQPPDVSTAPVNESLNISDSIIDRTAAFPQSQARIFKCMESLRRSRFFLESADRDKVQDGFRVEASIWNTTMTTGMIQLIEEVIQIFLSPCPTYNSSVVQQTASFGIPVNLSPVRTGSWRFGIIMEPIPTTEAILTIKGSGPTGGKGGDKDNPRCELSHNAHRHPFESTKFMLHKHPTSGNTPKLGQDTRMHKSTKGRVQRTMLDGRATEPRDLFEIGR
ncbi:hypothetical protein BCR41DRAFT_397845 [Lobosporangium transversale]|uniref:Uncharacterized protein n=1 Tax=Lobosporangium transversale TaxID=64571 RepID=A0A1Y2GLL3_9FUNG|nr:hypothetical protein BCR41DRAFT_398166 [Lobosporangium transversale]XP_021879790.1 hypothetical protein BCR41DRAFT_397845 [Lobosporangium transversale]ORZ11002.1 hypothetical protein BCR41DRAFT_398166 [Lobosporangium transversale]ORZ11693.1 hypothetical protein BCR41DRAFT_397845 [Lobosporangium transversale]|eukprot:XP_021879519.1 hypothetical protein BCR41DRAFT_398166 [Lobosporangium transversale]